MSSVSASHRRRGWGSWVGLAISLGCIGWAFFVLDWRQVGIALKQARWGWLLFAIVAILRPDPGFLRYKQYTPEALRACNKSVKSGVLRHLLLAACP